MIWVIGSECMLGSELCSQLSEKGDVYTAADKEVDITEMQALASFTEDKIFDWMVNCSAYTAVDRAEDDKELAYGVNAEGVRNLANTAKSLDVPIIHISTDYVFPGNVGEELRETDPTGPVSVYGKSKMQGEVNVREIWEKYIIIRTAWLYGKHGSNFVYTMLKLMKSRDQLKVVKDQVGTPTNAADLASAIITILRTNSNHYGIYHYSGEGRTTWYEFAREIYRLAREYEAIQKDCSIYPVSSTQFPTKAIRPAFSLLSKKKIKETFGVSVPYWKESLKQFFEKNQEYLRELYS